VDRDLVTTGTLYVVATPLGHLGDLSARGAEILRSVPLVIAEDTRHTRKLLSHLGAHAKLASWHAHSPASRLDALVRRLAEGGQAALVTDAGTPAISDPGAVLVARARRLGVTIVPVPGPSAVAAALSVSGFPSDRFTFLGFLPRRGAERRRLLKLAAESAWPVVFFESPGRLAAGLEDLSLETGPQRAIVVARELTKLHEEVRPGAVGDLAVYYRETPPRGEITVVVSGREMPGPMPPAEAVDPRQKARELLAKGTSRRDVARLLARDLGIPRNEAYRMVAEL